MQPLGGLFRQGRSCIEDRLSEMRHASCRAGRSDSAADRRLQVIARQCGAHSRASHGGQDPAQRRRTPGTRLEGGESKGSRENTAEERTALI